MPPLLFLFLWYGKEGVHVLPDGAHPLELPGGGQMPFQFLIAADPMFRQVVHGLSRLFQIIQLRPVRKTGTLLCFDIILNINEQADPPVTLLRLFGWTGASGDPGGNGFLRVIRVQDLHPGKTFLVGGSVGNVFPPPDLVPFPLQAEQQIFQVGGGGDQAVDGRFQR